MADTAGRAQAALGGTKATGNDEERLQAIRAACALVAGAPEERRLSVVSEALLLASSIRDEERRGAAVVAVAEVAPSQLHEAIVAAASDLGPVGRIQASARLALLTGGESRAQAIVLALETAEIVPAGDAFPDLRLVVDLLDDDQVDALLARVAAWGPMSGFGVVGALLRRLPGDRHAELLEASGASFAIWFPDEIDSRCIPDLVGRGLAEEIPAMRALWATAFLPRLEGGDADRARDALLDVVRTAGPAHEQLAQLSNALAPGSAWPDAVAMADDLLDRLAATELPPTLLPDILGWLAAAQPDRFDHYLELATRITDPYRQMGALQGLAAVAPADRRRDLVQLAVDLLMAEDAVSNRLGPVLREVGPLDDASVTAVASRLAELPLHRRTEALCGLASAATAPARGAVLDAAAKAARSVEPARDLVEVAALSEPPAAGRLLAEALRRAVGSRNPPGYVLGPIIEAWQKIAFEGAAAEPAGAPDVAEGAAAVSRSFLLDTIAELAPLVRHLDAEDAATLAGEIVQIARVTPTRAPATPRVPREVQAPGLVTQPGLEDYMQEASGACHIVVRNADDVAAARHALDAFRNDLYTSDVFASLDGEFGPEPDGTDIRYTPSFATAVEVTGGAPTFWFDADDILDCWPELIPGLIAQLRLRLAEAGVERAEIGFPTTA